MVEKEILCGFFIKQNKYKVFLDIIKEFMRVFNTNQKKVLPPKKEKVKKKKMKIAHDQLFFFPFLPTSVSRGLSITPT